MSHSGSREYVLSSMEAAVAHLGDAMRELDRMPAGEAPNVRYVGHLLNNYLSVADATLDLLSNVVGKHPDPDIGRWLAGLRHLGSLMGYVVGHLVNATSPVDLPLKHELFDLSTLMGRACEYYRTLAESKQLGLTFVATGEIPRAWGDRAATAVVADNLLSNAVKFSPPGGSISVEVVPAPGGVTCHVRDRGPGLTPSEQRRLFQRGARLGPTGTAGEPSHGYGLAIVRDLVERMGGRVWYESEPPYGSCFSFSLPYETPAQKS
jgi:signal transduction histidine kinase